MQKIFLLILQSWIIKKKVSVRDLWNKKDLGDFENNYQQKVNAHGAALIRISEK